MISNLVFQKESQSIELVPYRKGGYKNKKQEVEPDVTFDQSNEVNPDGISHQNNKINPDEVSHQ
jgi:hypothetical protein